MFTSKNMLNVMEFTGSQFHCHIPIRVLMNFLDSTWINYSILPSNGVYKIDLLKMTLVSQLFVINNNVFGRSHKVQQKIAQEVLLFISYPIKNCMAG